MNARNTALINDIVVVDNDIANLKLLAEILTHAGYHVRSANSGALALQSIYAKPPTLILLDIRMPEIDGFEVCTRLKADKKTCDIPIIFLSALTDIEDRTHGFYLGAADYITKPFQEQDVLMRVRAHISLFLAQTRLKQQNLELERLAQQLKSEITARESVEILLRSQQENLEELINQRTKELKKNHQKYQSLFFEARDGIVLLDVENGRIVDCNPEFELQSGRNLSQLKTMCIWEIHPAQEREETERLFYQVVANGVGHSDELRLEHPDGVILPIEFVTKRIQLEKKQYLQAIVRDISERKQMEEAQNASDKRFRQLFETMREGSYLAELIFDEAGNAVDWRYLESNPVHAQSLGKKREEIVGQTLWKTLPTMNRFWFDAAVHTALTGEPITLEGFGRATQRYYECRFYSPSHGQIACILNDITEHKQAEAERDSAEKKLREALESTIQTLSTALEMRDPYTAGHQKRVAKLAVMLAKELGLTEMQIQGIYFGGLLHDIGKITIPSEILNKPGRLSEIEFLLIKQHPQKGYEIVKEVDFPWPVKEMIYQHHEYLDGSGYPRGLSGDAIIFEAKILAVADTVEAMYSHRPYRPGLGIDKALAEIKRGRDSHFAPEVVDVCLKLFVEQSVSVCEMLNSY